MPRKPPTRSVRRSAKREAAGNGLIARVIDRTFENPAMSGGLLVMALTASAIASNALFLQSGRHPDPLFTTRSAPAAVSPRPAALAQSASTQRIEDVAIENPPMPRLAPHPVAPDPAPRIPETAVEPEAPAPLASPAEPTVVSAGHDLVTDVQRALARVGLYHGTIDGVPGPQTEAAIRAFETAAGIVVTGALTPELLTALKQPLPPRQTQSIVPGNTEAAELNRRERERAAMIAAEQQRQAEIRDREIYRVVQTALNRIGYGPLPVDGAGGTETLDAIRRFELDNGMPVTGEATDALMTRLHAIGAIQPG